MAILLATAIAFTPVADTGTAERISQAEHDLFMRIIEAEADPRWDLEGYCLLAHAVMNQLDSGLYGDTLTQVLTRPGNYTVYENGRYLKAEPSENARLAVSMALQRFEKHNHGQMYFCTDWHYPVSWHKTRPEVARYKGVVFVS